MSVLPEIGSIVQMFGVGCEGCGHFRGDFKVESVEDKEVTRIIVDPQEIHCEGVQEGESFASLVVEWDRELECWLTDCNGSPIIVNIGGHYRGPSKEAA